MAKKAMINCYLLLPTCLLYSGDLALVSQFPEADSANAVFFQNGVGSAAYPASGVCSCRILRSPPLALPRVRDFKGVPADSFDGRGNYAMGMLSYTLYRLNPSAQPDFA